MSLNESVSEPVATVSTVFEIVSENEILPAFTYNKNVKLNPESIDSFNVSPGKNKNDEKNKTRENIIGAIINNKVPNEYFNIKKLFRFHIYSLFSRYHPKTGAMPTIINIFSGELIMQ